MAMSPTLSSELPSTAAANGARGQLALLCRVRSWYCALDVGQVDETMRPLPIEPLAGAPAFVRGLSIIRGAPTPVVDAGTLLGAPDEPRSTRLIVLRSGERKVALAVEGVLGVRAISAELLRDLPPLLRGARREVVAAVGSLDAELLVVLAAGHLVPESVWSTIGAFGEIR
jgi:purine-binding chemotaxis protein CheW